MSSNNNDIAVIGLGGRFPGANNVVEYWENIKNGINCIRFFSDEELKANNVSQQDINNDNYIKAKGVIDAADEFAAPFFGYNDYDAKLMDPQHRLLLEVAYHALEDAGIVLDNYEGPIGTFVSAGFNTYLLHSVSVKPELHDSKNTYQLAIANGTDFLATKISYKLNLTGPAQTIQTACSSSLVAVHCACQSLLSFESDVALAGGVCVTTPLSSGYLYKSEGIGSPNGMCRPFDKDAAGTVPGNGAGIVVLKRLEDAKRDNDHIYAVIKGSAINNDGNKKISYTAPSIPGQEYVVRMAHALSAIDPQTIGYIEAHGTGTSLGDPIEIEALKRAFKEVSLKETCAIGSVKANIGHLDTAAGISGFIKTILMLHHKQLPPQINFDTLNPRISFSDSPFYVNTVLKSWEPAKDVPRRAGISAFGIGGTNVHFVLEEYKQPEAQQHLRDDWQILPFTAENASILSNVKTALVHYLNENYHIPLQDVAYTLQNRRRFFPEKSHIFAKRKNGQLQYLDAGEFPEDLDPVQRMIIDEWYNNEGVAWLHPIEGATISLPGYPFKRHRYWIEAKPKSMPESDIRQVSIQLPLRPTFAKPIIQTLTEILKECLGIDHLPIDAEFESLGADSLMTIDIIAGIEEGLKCRLSTGEFAAYNTILKLAEYIEKRKNLSIHTPILPAIAIDIRAGNSEAPTIFFIHPAGGAVAVFQEIAEDITKGHRIIAIRSRGWDGKSAPDDDIHVMAQTYYKAIKAIQKAGPYYICGSSIGGTIAFEIARLFAKYNEKIALLALIDSPATFANNAMVKVPETDQEILSYIIKLSPDMAMNLEDLEKRDKHSATFYQLWKAHARSLINYQPLPLDVEIVYFSAIDKNEYLPKDMLSDWLLLAHGGVEIHNIPGNHLTVHQADSAKQIAQILNKKIEMQVLFSLYATKDLPMRSTANLM